MLITSYNHFLSNYSLLWKVACGSRPLLQWLRCWGHQYSQRGGYTSLLYRYKYVLFKIKINTIRDTTPQNQELLEMKKVYTHPNYKYPSLYDDIAVVELGRRIVYDYEQEILFFSFLHRIELIPSSATLHIAWTRGRRPTLTLSPLSRDTGSLSTEIELRDCWLRMWQ